ncbi:uncharacterized protein LOC128893078 isoform X1 [Hylaeus anthracinus]|uniref:uncharacterized protein LOC128893078 isoform X1 n=2 Tax=Hylaeus anthracinus TaxID=313031 RepID=UPI0023BA29EB|nr:uncharacterized protein LOC128893078 isoform X1 [Hylaeus anthracinus]
MNVVDFTKEFTELISRWKRPTFANVDGSQSPVVTNDKLLNAIQDVLQVQLGVNLRMPDYSSVKTPATGIAVCTPNAPTILKPDIESGGYLARFGSLDTLMLSCESKNILSPATEPPKSGGKMEVVENKAILRSDKVNHANSAKRSDTFVREEARKKSMNGVVNQKGDDGSPRKEPVINDLKKIINDMLVLRRHAADVVSKIDDMKQKVYPQTIKPIRRLSSVGVYSSTSRTSTLTRPPPSSKHRRSTSGVLGTPTSSKLNLAPPTEKSIPLQKRKST